MSEPDRTQHGRDHANVAGDGDEAARGPDAAGSPRRSLPKVPAWQLLDGPIGWGARGEIAATVRAAMDEAAARIAEADARAQAAAVGEARARAQTEQLRARRVLRVTEELGATRRDASVGSLPKRLLSATRSVDMPQAPAAPTPAPPAAPQPTAPEPIAPSPATPQPAAPEPPTPQPAASEPTPDPLGAPAGATRPHPPAPIDAPYVDDRDRMPELRILHLGVVARFGVVAQHTPLAPEGWRDQLRAGADLVLIEPPPHSSGWDPTDGELPAILRAADELDIPTVRIHTDAGDTDAPGTARLELVEAADGDLPPSVEHTAFHPRGWTALPPDPVSVLLAREPDTHARSLLASFDPAPMVVHPPDLPVPSEVPVERGPEAATPTRLGQQLRRTGVVLDGVAWRGSASDQLRSWLAALACGTPVVTIAEDGLPEVPGVVRTSADAAVDTVHALLADRDRRERLGIVGRRHALTAHSRRTALGAILDHLGIGRPAEPRVSVLLATHRPELVGRALEQIAIQRYGQVDVSLVLHGAGFDDVDVADTGVRIASVIRAPSAWTLGACLNAGLDRTTGELVAKMDDDDHYGPDHLDDLVLAWRHSGADVVGKRIEFIHLAERDVTLRRVASRPERDRPHVGGPTLLADRATLRRFRFLRLPNRVDSTLYERVLAAGGRVYGTHSRDVVLARHGASHAHAWDVAEGDLLDGAQEEVPGLDLAFASSDPS